MKLYPHLKYVLVSVVLGFALLISTGVVLAQEDEAEAEDSPLLCLLYENDMEPTLTVIDPVKDHRIELVEGFNLLSDVEALQRLDGTPLNIEEMVVALNNCVAGGVGDGRINDGPRQLGAPVAIFCGPLGSVAVWDINAETGNGTIAISATGTQIDTLLGAAAASGAPVLIGAGLGNELWASPDDFLAVIGPSLNEPDKLYRFNFAAETCG
ncbi:MAG: hypothetical protein D6737_08105 [Chloroflexi bacterium]|nr:MAG: hypothetical protein D6737_08105 [Chloroflexota bacterium]